VNTTNATQWQQFTKVVESLNSKADLNTVYKVLFMGRHGEGFHNAAETYYGTPSWNVSSPVCVNTIQTLLTYFQCYFSELDGNGTTTWADADLTAPGIEQAKIANAYWRDRIATQHLPYPQSYYTSPLTRCLKTANLTFSDLALPEEYPFNPTIKELLREGISTHTCDRRSNKTSIEALFPSLTFEPEFPEHDPFWSGILAETSAAQDARSKRVLDDLFAHDANTWLSITSHSGEIRSLLRVLGHREFSLGTGAVIPVLVEAKWETSNSSSSSTTLTAPASTSTSFCTNGPQITSVATGCVCSSDGGVESQTGSSATATATAY
jgi:broad specificity phosphatase PhoE